MVPPPEFPSTPGIFWLLIRGYPQSLLFSTLNNDSRMHGVLSYWLSTLRMRDYDIAGRYVCWHVHHDCLGLQIAPEEQAKWLRDSAGVISITPW